jgi:hypothetical protein
LVHQFTALFQGVAPAVSLFSLVPDDVRQRCLGDFAGELETFPGQSPETGTEARPHPEKFIKR